MRHELKFTAPAAARARLLAELRLLPAALREQHPPRTVQSIYLDTASGQAVEENLAGVADRRKLRFRWYGEATGSVQGHLELKRRHGAVGDKLQCDVPRPLAVTGNTRGGFVRALRAQLPPAWQLLLDGREVAQWIRYRRDYLATADGRLRVTVDTDLCAFDLRYDHVLAAERPTPLPRLLVLEVKAAPDDGDELVRLLQGLDLQPGRCSKFVLASRRGDGPLPAPGPY